MTKYWLGFAALLVAVWSVAQNAHTQEVLAWQAELNASFAEEATSPLDAKTRKKFKSLDFYPIDSTFRVIAQFERTPNELPVTMPTTRGERRLFDKFGVAKFELDGKMVQLTLYQSHQLRLTEEYKNYLFLPFTDLTTGDESYGGGRYLDLTIPEGNVIILDFNKAYNPTCAYNENYSCPIPPRENDLPVAISAGVKNYTK